MITATTPDINEANRIYHKRRCLVLLAPCERCGMWQLVDREKDKVGETICEVRGMNYHDGLAHYVCNCGQPFDMFIDL